MHQALDVAPPTVGQVPGTTRSHAPEPAIGAAPSTVFLAAQQEGRDLSDIYLREVDQRFAPVVEHVLARAHLRTGQRVLDLGTGTGAVAAEAEHLERETQQGGPT